MQMLQIFFLSLKTKFYSLWFSIFRKNKMADIIRLNCLVIHTAIPESISVNNIIVLEIPTNKPVDILKPMIKERFPLWFENIIPYEFVLHNINVDLIIDIHQQ